MALSNMNDSTVTVQETNLNLGAMLDVEKLGVLWKNLTSLRSPQCTRNARPASERTVRHALIGDPCPPSGMWSHSFPSNLHINISRSKHLKNSPSQQLHFFRLIDKFLLPFAVCSSDIFNSFHGLNTNILENQLKQKQ